MAPKQQNRREFLEESMIAAASTISGSVALGESHDTSYETGANQRLGVAVLGARGRGATHLQAYGHRPDTEVVVICDPDLSIAEKRADEIARTQGRRPQVLADPRQVFDLSTVDIVSIATPNHWHALAAVWAMQAGKDVYVEKPVSHNVAEGRRMVQTSRRYHRICQAGLQARSHPGIRQAIEYLQGGELGAIQVARGITFTQRKAVGEVGLYQPPSDIDMDLWLGPAHADELARPRFHFDWHWQWAFGNGELGNQGIHQIDIARWGLGHDGLSDRVLSYGGRYGVADTGETPNTQVVHHEYGQQSLVAEVRGLVSTSRKNIRNGVIFECEDGYLAVAGHSRAAAFSPEGRLLRSFSGRGDHFGNFVRAVRGRRLLDLNADIEQGHLSSALCHLANISIRLATPLAADEARAEIASFSSNEDWNKTFQWTLKHLAENGISEPCTPNGDLLINVGRSLVIDALHEGIVGDAEASALLSADYRPPYTFPAEADTLSSVAEQHIQ